MNRRMGRKMDEKSLQSLLVLFVQQAQGGESSPLNPPMDPNSSCNEVNSMVEGMEDLAQLP
jgi:hypothetical protein